MGFEERESQPGAELRARRRAAEPARPSGGQELAVFAGDAVSVHMLPPSGQVTIGRAEGNDIRIDDASISRRHAVLHLGPPLRIEDLGSANGTFVRDRTEPVEEGATQDLRPISRQSVEIALGERINLGRTMLVVRRATRIAPRPQRSASLRGEDGETAVVLDPVMQSIYAEATRAASAMISVLVLGETGVGKEVLARAIHRRSPRAGGPFIALNCAALPESLLETELFGHERGAFTGAADARPGLFEAAAGGTVFLDEVGELPTTIQVKLLRVLEDKQVYRVGARSPRPIDVRFIAATNRDLEAAVERETFRTDFFFRLNGISLTIPPLRDRPAEVPALAERFVEVASQELDRSEPPTLSAEALDLLARYPFPGNVRELRNVIDRAVVLCEGANILPEHLPAKLFPGATPPPAPAPAPAKSADRIADPPVTLPGIPAPIGADPAANMANLRSQMEELERRRIIEALERCGGNQTQAAELLGVSRRTLINRLDEYNVPRPRKKS